MKSFLLQKYRPFEQWVLRRQQRSSTNQQYRVRSRNGDSMYSNYGSSSSSGSQELSGSARTRLGSNSNSRYSMASARIMGSWSGNGSSTNNGSSQRQGAAAPSYSLPLPHPQMYRNPHHHFHIHHAMAGNPTSNSGDEPGIPQDSGVRFYPGYIPEILITRA